MKRKVLALVCSVCMMCAVFFGAQEVKAATVTVEVDGDPSEWTQMPSYWSNRTEISKWSMAQDDEFYYFYVQERNGNEYGHPGLQGNNFVIDYDETADKAKTMIQTNGVYVKDGVYADIAGAQIAVEYSDWSGLYEAEFKVPKTFFAGRSFTVTYCGTTIKSTDVKTWESKSFEIKNPTYTGISIDGSFYDWQAVGMTTVGNGAVEKVAMVFDGDVYIYIKETSLNAAASSGEYSNGMFTILTDTGRNVRFQLTSHSIKGVEGASVAHVGLQYEICIPASALREYNNTISFGYYLAPDTDNDGVPDMLIKDVADMKGSSTDYDESKIVFDGLFGDWSHYPMQVIQYATPGTKYEDRFSEGALYVDGTDLIGYVNHVNCPNGETGFGNIDLRFNGNDNMILYLSLVEAKADGTFVKDNATNGKNLAPGNYVFYLRDVDSQSSSLNIYDEDADIYGKVMVTVSENQAQMEYKFDLAKAAEHFGLDTNELHMIQARYINLGTRWISHAGSSTAPVIGISLSCAAVLAVLFIRKKRTKAA